MKCVVVCYYVAEVYVRIAALPLLQGNAFLLQLLHTQAEIGAGLFITGQEVIREFPGHNGGGLTVVMYCYRESKRLVNVESNQLIRIVIDKIEDVLIYQTTSSQSRHHDSFKNQIIAATDTTTYQHRRVHRNFTKTFARLHFLA